MQVHLFQGVGPVFGCTADATGGNLPSRYGRWVAFKVLDMKRGDEPRPGMDTDECLDDIEKHGFHLTEAHVRITESAL